MAWAEWILYVLLLQFYLPNFYIKNPFRFFWVFSLVDLYWINLEKALIPFSASNVTHTRRASVKYGAKNLKPMEMFTHYQMSQASFLIRMCTAIIFILWSVKICATNNVQRSINEKQECCSELRFYNWLKTATVIESLEFRFWELCKCCVQ